MVDDLGFTPLDIKRAILTAAGSILAPAADRARLVAEFQQALAVDGAGPLPAVAGA